VELMAVRGGDQEHVVREEPYAMPAGGSPFIPRGDERLRWGTAPVPGIWMPAETGPHPPWAINPVPTMEWITEVLPLFLWAAPEDPVVTGGPPVPWDPPFEMDDYPCHRCGEEGHIIHTCRSKTVIGPHVSKVQQIARMYERVNRCAARAYWMSQADTKEGIAFMRKYDDDGTPQGLMPGGAYKPNNDNNNNE